MTQEFHISVTPIGDDDYLVRTERVAPGVPLAEEQVSWPVDEWLERAAFLMNDPIAGLLRGDGISPLSDPLHASLDPALEAQAQRSINLNALGQQLYNALFQGTIRDSWMTAQGIAQHRQEILRLRLGLKDNRLPRLPWEVLHAGDRPLATGTDVLFSRYNSSFAAMSSFQYQQVPMLEPGQSLKILLVLAAPSDQEMLALKQEALHLQEELQSLPNGNRNGLPDIQLTILEQPGREQLTQALEHSPYQVLHYAGHSNLGTSGGKLYLVSSKTGLTEALSGDDLAGLLVNNGIRMAVFNSCRGAYTATTAPSRDDSDGNLAEALVKRGIPAVLAMAERIPDDVALNLSRLFYRNLKQLYPIDLSLSRARQGLLSSYGSNQMYWALPILYLHPEFGGYLQTPIESADRLLATQSFQPPFEEHDWEAAAVEGDAIEDPLQPEEPYYTVANDEFDIKEFDTDELDSETFGSEIDASEDPSFDPDELEFEDPDYQPELEIANLVQQLSGTSAKQVEDEAILPASPTESLLPEKDTKAKPEDYLVLPDKSRHYTAPTPAPAPRRTAAALGTDAPTLLESDDGSVYLELERLLAETGKPTEAIATCNREIQQNPANPRAYDHLGVVLSQQGYLSEAVVAYQQAIRINPSLAEVHNHLGSALYQLGKTKDAIRAYSRAVQLNPNFKEAKQNLDVALRRQGVHLSPNQLALGNDSIGSRPITAPAPTAPYVNGNGRSGNIGNNSNSMPAANVAPVAVVQPGLAAPQTPYARAKKLSLGQAKRSLLWAGAGSMGVAALILGGWFVRNHFDSSISHPPSASPPPAIVQIKNAKDLKTADTPSVVAFATEQLKQGDIQEGKAAIEVLLDRQKMEQAIDVMRPLLNQRTDNPTINFLMGRAAWQYAMADNPQYSVEDARRYWEASTAKSPSVEAQNALGFAYYALGNLEAANTAWLKALQLSEGQPSTKNVSLQTRSQSSQAALTASAGLGLVLMKQAASLPPAKRSAALNEAIQLRKKVLKDNPPHFKPEALAQDWMWSKAAIEDWKTLSGQK